MSHLIFGDLRVNSCASWLCCCCRRWDSCYRVHRSPVDEVHSLMLLIIGRVIRHGTKIGCSASRPLQPCATLSVLSTHRLSPRRAGNLRMTAALCNGDRPARLRRSALLPCIIWLHRHGPVNVTRDTAWYACHGSPCLAAVVRAHRTGGMNVVGSAIHASMDARKSRPTNVEPTCPHPSALSLTVVLLSVTLCILKAC